MALDRDCRRGGAAARGGRAVRARRWSWPRSGSARSSTRTWPTPPASTRSRAARTRAAAPSSPLAARRPCTPHGSPKSSASTGCWCRRMPGSARRSGFLRAPIAYEIVRSQIAAARRVRPRRRQCAPRRDARARPKRSSAAAPPTRRLTETRSAFMRYRGQGHEIAVPLPTKPYRREPTPANPARRLRGRLSPALQPHHPRRRSRGPQLGPAVRSAATAPAEARRRRRHRPSPYTPEPARHRPVFDPEAGEFVEVAIHDRQRLRPGAQIPGPAIIVEDETSTVVTRNFDARIDRFGYIELTRRPS